MPIIINNEIVDPKTLVKKEQVETKSPPPPTEEHKHNVVIVDGKKKKISRQSAYLLDMLSIDDE